MYWVLCAAAAGRGEVGGDQVAVLTEDFAVGGGYSGAGRAVARGPSIHLIVDGSGHVVGAFGGGALHERVRAGRHYLGLLGFHAEAPGDLRSHDSLDVPLQVQLIHQQQGVSVPMQFEPPGECLVPYLNGAEPVLDRGSVRQRPDPLHEDAPGALACDGEAAGHGDGFIFAGDQDEALAAELYRVGRL